MLTPKGHIACPAEFSSFKCQNPYIMRFPAGEMDFYKRDKTNYKAFPCNKCIYCRKRKQKQWTTRLSLECEAHEHNSFVTLTYKEYDPFIESELFRKSRSLDYTDIQKFHKHLKMNVKRQGDKTYKHFNAGEYGEINTQRAHWHLILFGFADTERNRENIFKIWKYSDLKERVIEEIIDTKAVGKYVSKYVLKNINLNQEQYKKIYNKQRPLHHGSTGLGWETAKSKFLIPALESFKEFGDFNHIIYDGKKIFLDRYLTHKLALLLGETLQCGNGIKNAITHKGLEQLKEYVAETKEIYKLYAPDEFNDETLPEYKYYTYDKKIDEQIDLVRKSWWYRHKAHHYNAEKILKLSELARKTKKNAV